MLVLDSFKCILCPSVYENYRSLVSHDNKAHGGYGLKYNKTKWCEGCRAYRDNTDFYEGYSRCKEHSNAAKKKWLEGTTKGYRYKNRKFVPSQQYNKLVNTAEKLGQPISLTKEQYLDKLENGTCDYCHEGFQGVMFMHTLQPAIGLSLYNVMASCAICETKHKYNLK
jgi:hypothetical protein